MFKPVNAGIQPLTSPVMSGEGPFPSSLSLKGSFDSMFYISPSAWVMVNTGDG